VNPVGVGSVAVVGEINKCYVGVWYVAMAIEVGELYV
jgi:hypothetical protein